MHIVASEKISHYSIGMGKVGRRALFTSDIVEQVLERVGLGDSEYGIIRELKLGWSTWCRYKQTQYEDGGSKEFRDKYARAKESGLKVWEQKIVDVASDRSKDLQPYQKYSAKTGELIEDGVKSDNTAVNRDRLIVDSMKWLMSKMDPKIYGDKFQQEVTGKDGGPVQYSVLVDRPVKETPEQWQERVEKQIEARAAEKTRLH